MYSHPIQQHRAHPNSRQQSLQRFGDAIDLLRQEFENVSAERDSLRAQKEEYEAQSMHSQLPPNAMQLSHPLVTLQISEVNAIRRSLVDLETQQTRVRQHYEDELRRLRSEINSLHPSASHSGIPGFKSLGTPRLPPPPTPLAIGQPGPGPSTSDTFGRARAASGAAYDRERGMEKSRAPTPLEKEGPNSDNWEMRQQQKAREFRERAERENDRMVDIRDTKRLKSDHGESVLAPIPFDRLK